MAFVSIRRYEVDAASVPEIIKRAQEGFVPIIRSSPGFIAYRGIDAGDGVVATISVFESKEQADASNEKAAGWVKDNLAALVSNPPQVTAGEVVISEQA